MPDDAHSPNDDPTQPSPRAFVTTSGFVFQTVGAAYFLAGGAYWFISGSVQERATVRIDSVMDYFAEPNLLLTVTTALILSSVGGGLALIAFGLGMQGETPRSGIGASIAAGMLTATGLAGTVLYLALGPAWLRAVAAGLYTVVNGILFLLAGHSASILKRHPAPPDRSMVNDAWLEEHHRNRRKRGDMI